MILTVPVSRKCDTSNCRTLRTEKWTCPVGHVTYQFDLPSHDLYLPRAVVNVYPCVGVGVEVLVTENKIHTQVNATSSSQSSVKAFQ